MRKEDRRQLTFSQVEDKRDRLRALYKKSSEIGERYSESVSDGAWHDNPLMEQSLVELRVLDSQIKSLESQLGNSELVELEIGSGAVTVGSMVELKQKDGEYFKISIGLNTEDKETSTVSIDTPIAEAILGKKVGDVARVESQNPYEVEVVDIS